MERTVVHVISHSHWDREWYMAFEEHRMRLVQLIDDVLELFEKDREFKSFHLDGQTVMLEDYLQIRPENRERLQKYIREGRLFIGPWYVLQDEFLTSGESNVRNLLAGLADAKAYGTPCMVGYFPDAFGNVGQMPQVLKQAGMRGIVFGRGVRAVGFDNKLENGGDYEASYSEMLWQSPDGSALPAILFATWYNNGMEIPVEEEAAKRFWDKKLAEVGKYAGTRHLLFMNGCDHQPVQKNLSAALAVARRLYPEITFVHSNFPAYLAAVTAEWKTGISCVQGELDGQDTDGRFTLANTASSRIDIKMMNRRCEAILEKGAEPLCAFAAIEGDRVPGEFLNYGWRTLMKNHPHDSICCCSVDEVMQEMKLRFQKSEQVARGILSAKMRFLADKLGSSYPWVDGRKCPVMVWNPAGSDAAKVLSVVVEYDRCREKDFQVACRRMRELVLPRLALWDAEGRRVDCRVEDLGSTFAYDLPDDRFRQPYAARSLRLTFEAKVPALGYSVYTLGPDEEGTGCFVPAASLVAGERSLENAFLRVDILEDGSYTLTEKKSGRRFEAAGWYEDCGDVGNEYLFVQPEGSPVITTKGGRAQVKLVENEPYRAAFCVEQILSVPVSGDGLLAEEQKRMVNPYERRAGRSGRKISLRLTTTLRLERGSRGLWVETRVENRAKDHRLRVVFPTCPGAGEHLADTVFDVVRRPNRPGKRWKNPSRCLRCQNFVAVRDEEAGLMTAGLGLYEYEVIPRQDNALALTLLRCVGEMGDWGAFPTKESQMQGNFCLQYEVIPFAADSWEEACEEGYRFSSSLEACQVEKPLESNEKADMDGPMPLSGRYLEWTGPGCCLSAFKPGHAGNDIFARFIHVEEGETELVLRKLPWMAEIYKSDVLENRGEELTAEKDGFCRVQLGPKEILTLGFRKND